MSHVDLTRRFHDLDNPYARDEDATWANSDFGALSWSDLLASPRVLIVSEAGTGKSHECQAECARQWSHGEPAFWVELSNLATSELPELFGDAELKRFKAWKKDAASVATFFLDSIDELQLTQASFDHALKAVSRSLGARVDRARIVVTSRPTDFDRDAVLRHLPVPQRRDVDAEPMAPGDEFVDLAMGRRQTVRRQDAPTAPPSLRLVSLDDLTVEEIAIFAAHRGVIDPQQFVAALEAKNAISFASRPQDLIELASAWIETGQLQTHRKQVDLNVTVKLRPNARRRERDLPYALAREGARRLALAMLVTRRLALRHGDDSDNEAGLDTVLDPRQVLVEWKHKAIQALLQRGLFGHAGYGRVRMHHRSVVEYLAAEALQQLLDNGVRWRDVAAQLFATTPQGIDVLKPAMRPTAVWMAVHNTDVFSEILKRQPEALLQHGDPESLSGADRAKALFRYVDQAASRHREGVEFASAQLQRIVCPEVLNALPGRWRQGMLNPDVRQLFLRLFAMAPAVESAAIAHAVAVDPAGDGAERTLAAEVLVAANDPRLPALAQKLVAGHGMGPTDAVVSIAMRLAPHHMTADQLTALMVRVGTGRGDPGNTACGVLTRQIARGEFADSYVSALRNALVPIVVQAAVWDPHEYPTYYNRQPELVALLMATCARQVADAPRSVQLFVASIIATQFYWRDRSEDATRVRLRNAASIWPPTLKRIALVTTDVLLTTLHPSGSAWERLSAIRSCGLVALTASADGTWLLELLEDPRATDGARAVALEALLHGAVPPGLTAEALDVRVRRATAGHGALSAQLAALAVTPERSRAIARLQTADAREHKARETKANAERGKVQAFVNEIIKRPRRAFGAKNAAETSWRLWYTAHRNGGMVSWDRAFFDHMLGARVTNLLKVAMRQTWRTYYPTLPYERPDEARGTTLLVWGMGNGGLTAEAEDRGWASRLTPAEAALAARYIPLELNRFPPWLPDLIAARPTEALSVLKALLDDELTHLHDPERHATNLQHLSSAHSAIRALVLPHLEGWLAAHADHLMSHSRPATPSYSHQQLLRLVVKHGSTTSHAHLRTLCCSALQQPARKAWEQLWFRLLFRLDAPAALQLFAHRLGQYPAMKLGDGAELVGALFGDHDEAAGINPRARTFTPAMLLELVRLSYAHVRPIDDLHHVGVFTPGARDAAEHGRNALLMALLATRGPEGWDAKQILASEPYMVEYADRARAISVERAAGEAEGEPLTAEQAQALLTSGVVAPMDRDQMFLLLQHRLGDLEDLLNKDGSPRETWCKVTDEQEMRKLIGGALATMAYVAYTVGHEMTSADDKETDIRLISTASPETGVIELKIGNERSGRDLRDTVHEQLVKKYLRPNERKAGCLLVTVSRDRQWEHPDTGELLGIDRLRAMLASEAQRVEKLMLGTVRLTTHVMSLLPPLPREREAK